MTYLPEFAPLITTFQPPTASKLIQTHQLKSGQTSSSSAVVVIYRSTVYFVFPLSLSFFTSLYTFISPTHQPRHKQKHTTRHHTGAPTLSSGTTLPFACDFFFLQLHLMRVMSEMSEINTHHFSLGGSLRRRHQDHAVLLAGIARTASLLLQKNLIVPRRAVISAAVVSSADDVEGKISCSTSRPY